MDNTQLTIFGGFAPNSSSAEVLSKALGSRTVLSGSVSRGKNDPSQSLQMMERPLMTPDELKSLPKGQFVVMKTGVHPMRVKLKLFFKWGIEFDKAKPYEVKNNKNRKVEYAEKKEIVDGIVAKYHPEWLESEKTVPNVYEGGGQAQVQSEYDQPIKVLERITEARKDKDGKGGSGRMLQEIAPHNRNMESEVNTDGHA